MSKSNLKKFRKNDYSHDDEEETSYYTKNHLNKKESKRIERALKTRDITALIEDEESDYAYDSIYDEMADYDSWPDEREERR
jgi:hypothetical protein